MSSNVRLVQIFCPTLSLYYIVSGICWLNEYGINREISPIVDLIYFSLLGMIISTLMLFITHFICTDDKDYDKVNVAMVTLLSGSGGLYFIDIILAIHSEIYLFCHHDLCEMQMVQNMILPLTITFTICLYLYALQKNHACLTSDKCRIFIYVFIIFLEGVFNIYFIWRFDDYTKETHIIFMSIFILNVIIVSITLLILLLWPECIINNICSKAVILCISGVILAISLTFLLCFNIYAYIINYVYDPKLIYHYCLLFITGWFICIDIICYVWTFIILGYKQVEQLKGNHDTSSTSTIQIPSKQSVQSISKENHSNS